MNNETSPSVICFGEALWDSLPRGLFPGGAPFNVAYHLKQLGANPIPVTAVGKDQLGEELLRRMKCWQVDIAGVTVNEIKSTGLSRVTIVGGNAQYEIDEDAAWDWIEAPSAIKNSLANVNAIVFGSLAQRHDHNREQLLNLLNACPAALKVFDVNLRTPFDSAELVWQLAKHADLIKVNDHELKSLMNDFAVDLETLVRRFATRSAVKKICVTAGAAGAGLLVDGQWLWEPSQPVQVRDTVGAGDSFLAALLSGLLQRNQPLDKVLAQACRLAEFVATQDGATPVYDLAIFKDR